MINMSYSFNRKAHQSKINKVVRELNKNIANDYAWKGRFVVRQVRADWVVFEDHSGAYLVLYFELLDKLTHKGKVIRLEESQFFDSHIWEEMNKFITEDIKVFAPCIYDADSVPDFRAVAEPHHPFNWWKENYPLFWINSVVEV